MGQMSGFIQILVNQGKWEEMLLAEVMLTSSTKRVALRLNERSSYL